MSLDHDSAVGATDVGLPAPWSVFVQFHHNIADPGQPAAWTAIDDLGFPQTCTLIGFASNVVKLQFTQPIPGLGFSSVTYDNALGTGYNVLLQPLFTGLDLPVT